MAGEWIEFVNNLKDEAGTLAKSELVALITSLKGDSNEFVRKQTAKVERYLDQLARGEITKQDFERYVRQIARLTEMESMKLSVAARASARRITHAVEDLILGRLLDLLL